VHLSSHPLRLASRAWPAVVALALAVGLLTPTPGGAETGQLAIRASTLRGVAPLDVALAVEAPDPALTYTWDLGGADAPRAQGASVAARYSAPGIHQVTLRATDAAGATRTATATVTADEAAPACPSAASDTFAGDRLDTARWQVIRRDDATMSVGGGALHLQTTLTDNYGIGVGGLPRYPDLHPNPPLTPNVVVQPAPSGAWQATTQLTMAARDHYQQAGLLLMAGDGTGDDNYVKLTFQARGTGSAEQRTIQFMSETAGHPGEQGSNTPFLGAAFPDTVHLRLTSTGTAVRGAYSTDGTTWTDLGRSLSTLHVGRPQIGFIAFADTYDDPPVIDAAFASFSLTPDAPVLDDGFDAGSLATSAPCSRWTVVREDRAGHRVARGALEIDTSARDIYGATNTGPTNLVLQPAPAGDWTVETFVDASTFDQGFHNAGLLLYADDGNYVKLDYVTDGPGRGRLELRAEAADRVLGETIGMAAPQGRWYLRLQKEGPVYRGFASADGRIWTQLSGGGLQQVVHPGLEGARIGLYAWGGSAITAARTARFDYIRQVPR
jgi:cytochrome c